MDTSQILLKEEKLITFLIHKAFLDMEGAQNWHTQVIESMDTSQSPLRTEKDRKFPTVIEIITREGKRHKLATSLACHWLKPWRCDIGCISIE